MITGNQYSWNPTTKALSLGSQPTLTLGGTNYLRDTPEHCGLPSGTAQIDTQGGGKLSVTSGKSDDLAFLMAGSDSRTTYANFGGNTKVQNYMTLYAPKTIVDVQGNADYRGAIAGKEITVQGSVQVFGAPSSLTFTAAVELAYKRTRFVECTGEMPTVSPDTGC